MSDSDAGFRDKHQELEHLVQELKQTKELMRDISSKMTQIERHVKRAFLPLQANKRDVRDEAPNKKARIAEKPTITEEQALVIFDELKSLSLSELGNEALERLEKMKVPDLRMIAHEVGLTFASKPSKKLLISRIRSRINESMLLSKNVNVTQPRSAQVGNEVKSDLDEVDTQSMPGRKP